MRIMKTSAGIDDYAAGVGTAFTFGEAEKVLAAIAKSSQDAMLETADTIFSVQTSITGNVVNVLVFTQATVGGAGNAWTEIADHTDLSTLDFTVLADVE